MLTVMITDRYVIFDSYGSRQLYSSVLCHTSYTMNENNCSWLHMLHFFTIHLTPWLTDMAATDILLFCGIRQKILTIMADERLNNTHHGWEKWQQAKIFYRSLLCTPHHVCVTVAGTNILKFFTVRHTPLCQVGRRWSKKRRAWGVDSRASGSHKMVLEEVEMSVDGETISSGPGNDTRGPVVWVY